MPTDFAIQCWLTEVTSSPHSTRSCGSPKRYSLEEFAPSPSKRRCVLAPLYNPSRNNIRQNSMSAAPKRKGPRTGGAGHGGGKNLRAESAKTHKPQEMSIHEDDDYNQEGQEAECQEEDVFTTPRASRATFASRQGRGTRSTTSSPTRSPISRPPRRNNDRTIPVLDEKCPIPNFPPPVPSDGLSVSWVEALGQGQGSSRASRSASSAPSSSTASKRSASPSKTPADLLSAGIFFESLKKDKLSPASHQLYIALRDASDGCAVVPASLEDRINETEDLPLRSHMLRHDPPYTSTPSSQYLQDFYELQRIHHETQCTSTPTSRDLQYIQELSELQEIRRILDAASRCAETGSSESGWNVKVHGKLLDLAIGDNKSKVEHESVTHAKIASRFIPRSTAVDGEHGIMSSRLVDLAIVLKPDSRLQETISNALAHAALQVEQSDGHKAAREERSINQSTHQSLLFRPISVSIETKLETNAEDGACQLGIWAAAGFNRLRRLAQTTRRLRTPTDDTPDYKPIDLPLLRCSGHYWYLLFARDLRGLEDSGGGGSGRYLVLKEMTVGDTNTLLGLYKLVRVLRLLVEWSTNEFLPWLKREVLVSS